MDGQNSEALQKAIMSLGTIRDGHIYCTVMRNTKFRFFGFSCIDYKLLSRVLSEHSATALISTQPATKDIVCSLIITVDLSVSETTSKIPTSLSVEALDGAPFVYTKVHEPIRSGSSKLYVYAIPPTGVLTEVLDSILANPSTIKIYIGSTYLRILVLEDRCIRNGLAESLRKKKAIAGQPEKCQNYRKVRPETTKIRRSSASSLKHTTMRNRPIHTHKRTFSGTHFSRNSPSAAASRRSARFLNNFCTS